ncbi:MFS transporter [Caulobacter hibisci]|uniref:MFS transporter n=2 Tax=Caulobacter hibisci TaxID=2035993 RepID=A0ABS0T5G1_9CAUL|nr:MFS transporter [Caulobacter hibisci]MBI1686731.1 MFS transporter [Caulobacter hibisci]
MTPHWYRGLSGDARRAFWSSYAGFGLDAMDVQLYAFVMPALLALWGLSHAEAGLLASVTLACSALGGWAAGALSDRLGRVRVLTATILWLGVSTCLCGLARNFDQLLVARALQGLGFGAEWAAGAVFVAEMVSPGVRGRAVGAVQSAWALGWGLAALISAAALALTPPDLGWRLTFVVGLAPMVVIYLVRVRMRDSETFLTGRKAAGWTAIFAPGQRSITLRASLLAAGMHGGYWSIATWWPSMLHAERGFSATLTSVYFGVIVAGSLLGYLAGAWLGDVVGRRATLAGFALGAAITVLASTALPVSDTALLVLSFPLGVFALGMFSAIGPVLTELFPTEIRGAGLGFCYNIGRGVAGFAPALIGLRIDKTSLAHAIGLYATIAYVLVLAATALIPETRGKDLAAIAPKPALD